MDRPGKSYSGFRLIVVALVIGFVVYSAWRAWGQLTDEKQVLDAKIALLHDDLGTLATPAKLSELAQLESSRLSIANLGWSKVVASAVLYSLALLCSAIFWYTCLAAFGQSPPLRTTVAAHILGQVGKYVPGKAMVIVIRSSALHRHTGIGRIPAAIGVFVETLTMMACGATLAGICVLLIPAPIWVRLLAASLAVGAAVPTSPPLFHIVLSRLSKSRFGRQGAFVVDRYDWKLMAQGWGWMTFTWLLIGGSFWLMLLATPGVSVDSVAADIRSPLGYATALATISLAMVAGFLSLIPGGAGVREIVIAALLAPLVGTGVAVVAAILARLTFLLVECAASGLSWVVLRRLPTHTLPTHVSPRLAP